MKNYPPLESWRTVKRRRRFLFCSMAAFPALALARQTWAQPSAKIQRIGVLSSFESHYAARLHSALRLGLRDLGWVEGRNLLVEYRYAEGKTDRLSTLAGELVQAGVNVIVADSQSPALAAARASKTIPIVVAAAGDPVAGGLAQSLARPGGNVTGLTQIAPELAPKRLQLLKEMAPKLSRVAVLWNPKGDAAPLAWKEIQVPAGQLGIELTSLEVTSPNDFDRAFATTAKVRVDALYVISNPLMVTNMKRIVEFAAASSLPSMYQFADYADAGGLMSYGANRIDMFRRAATYVDKILKGTKPGDIPIEQPMRFELVVNMKTAKLLRLTIPPAIAVRIDRYIQ